MKKIVVVVCLALTFSIGVDFLSAAMSSANYQIWQDAISDGGGEGTNSTNYTVSDTIGQFAAGRSSSTDYGVRAGFREINYFAGDEVLSFSASASSLELGALSTGSTASGSITLTVETNSATGVSVTYTGNTLTCSACSGTNTVTAAGATAVASTAGTSQFGFNVIYSSGSSPVAASVSPYNTAGQYAFNSGDAVITSSRSINSTVFNVNFIANISGSETGGTYTTTVTYTATANF